MWLKHAGDSTWGMCFINVEDVARHICQQQSHEDQEANHLMLSKVAH